MALLIRPNNHQTLQIGHIFGWNVEGSTFILTDLISPVQVCLVSWCAGQFLEVGAANQPKLHFNPTLQSILKMIAVRFSLTESVPCHSSTSSELAS